MNFYYDTFFILFGKIAKTKAVFTRYKAALTKFNRVRANSKAEGADCGLGERRQGSRTKSQQKS